MKILLVDDHQIVRDGLRVCLEVNSQFTVVGEAADGLEAVRLATELQPDVIVMDVSLPRLNGIDATRAILAADSSRKVLCLSMHTHREFIAEAFRAGVSGYMVKSSAFQELVHALDLIAAGGKYISPAITDVVADDFVSQITQDGPTPFSILTPRERQILQMLAEGHSAKHIGAVLDISHKTVHAFRYLIMEKTGIDSLAELTKYAIRHGLTTME